MAVFTTLSTQDVRSRLPDFNIGELLSLEPIASGIENTNYFLDTTEGRWVLTVFERLSEEQLPFYLELCAHLRGQGCPVAAPVRTKNGRLFSHIKGKPFSIANRLEGSSIENVTPQECASMGEVLARMHLAAKSFTLFQENLRGPQWWKTTAPIVLPHLASDVGQMLSEEVSHQLAVFSDPDFKTLPVAACHCDLFRNNAMIVGHGTAQERVSGVFDFYFARLFCSMLPSPSTTGARTSMHLTCDWIRTRPKPFSRHITPCFLSRKPIAVGGQTCSEPPRSVSGSLACTTSTCRVRQAF